MANNNHSRDLAQWQKKLHVIIFGTQTITGRLFDIILIYAIILSIVAVMLESVQSIEESYGNYLRIIEWIFTILFTFEYIARILCSLHPLRYATSFMGIIDLLAFLPDHSCGIAISYGDPGNSPASHFQDTEVTPVHR